MERNVAVVFTGKSVNKILEMGGTASWRLNRNHAGRCTYVVCSRNSKPKYGEGGGTHGSAFLVGKVKSVVEVVKPGRDGRRSRYCIEMSEYAHVDVPHVWNGERNPVKYVATLQELGIEPDTLQWEPMPERNNAKAASD